METVPLQGMPYKAIDSGGGDVSATVTARLKAYFAYDKSGLKLDVAQRILEEAKDLSREDRAILLAIAEQESGFNPCAKNRASSAQGVFQIVNSTWRGLGFKEDERGKLTAQIKAGVKLYRENLTLLKTRGEAHGLKRVINMYRLHHDGCGPVAYGGEEIARRFVAKRFLLFFNLLAG